MTGPAKIRQEDRERAGRWLPIARRILAACAPGDDLDSLRRAGQERAALRRAVEASR